MRTNNSGNEDWWFSAIGGYGATDMLTSLYQADPAGQGCQSGTCTTIIEGFDGIPDKIVDQFTVTYGLVGKTGGAGTTTKASETTQAQNAITNTSTTPLSSTSTRSGSRSGSRSGYSTRHRRRSNRRRGYPSGNFGYKYTDAGYYDYWYEKPPIVIPVPVEVPVSKNENETDSLSTYTIPLAIVLSAMILVVGLKK